MQKASSRKQTLLHSPGSGLIPTYFYIYATSETVKLHPAFGFHFLCVSSFFPSDSEFPFLFIHLNSLLSSGNQLSQPFCKGPIFQTFPSCSWILSELSHSVWLENLPGFVTLFLRPWFLRSKPGSSAKPDSTRQIGAADTELCPNKLSLIRILMNLLIVLACPICQVKHENVLNYFTSEERCRELWGLGWWTDCNLTSFIYSWDVFKNCTGLTRKIIFMTSQWG